jgi:hypothetical protein
MTYRALLIGVADYDQAALTNLDGPVRDVELIAETLAMGHRS